MKPKRASRPATTTKRPAQSLHVIPVAEGQFDPTQFQGMDAASVIDRVPSLPLKDVMRELIAKFGYVEPGDGPEWEKRVAQEFGKCMMLPKSKQGASDDYQMGWYIGLFSALLPQLTKLDMPNPMRTFVSGITEPFSKVAEMVRAISAHGPPTEAKEFFDGQSDGQKQFRVIWEMSQRTKIFFYIAVLKRQVGEFKSVGALYRWLLDSRMILPGTDSAELRAVCRIIGLKFPGRAGRPPKQKSGATG